jgi:FAD-linked oxidoreductase
MARRWQNWPGSVRAAPREVVAPGSLDELARLAGTWGREGRHVRVVGAGHSFTPLVQTDDVLVSLDGMQGVISIDADNRMAKVWGGTHLKRLGDELLAQGLAQENLGDIDKQSIAGAISTGTHGTGVNFGSIATQVVGLTLVTASGEVLECSVEQHPDIFKAAQVSLGALGIVAAVTLRVVPAQRLHYQARREPLAECLANLERYKAENSHFEFYYFPFTKWAQVKFANETDAPPNGKRLWGTVNDLVLENGLFWVLSEACRAVPRLTYTGSAISAWGVASVDETNHSHEIFATPRLVRFQEMEYSLPAEQFVETLEEVRACIDRERFRVHFPLECRFVCADDIWLSPAYGRDSAYIAAHMYRGMPYREYFAALEEIFLRHGGRPHWGKHHTLDAAQLASLYPHWQDFLRVRAQLDPQGVFLNDYLRRLFGIDAPQAASVVVPDGTAGAGPA